jgi:hypothetical protein
LDAVFDAETYQLTVAIPAGLEPGDHTVRIHFENVFKHSVLNDRFRIRVE